MVRSDIGQVKQKSHSKIQDMGVRLLCAAGMGMKQWLTTAATRRRRGSTWTQTSATPCAMSSQRRWLFTQANVTGVTMQVKVAHTHATIFRTYTSNGWLDPQL